MRGFLQAIIPDQKQYNLELRPHPGTDPKIRPSGEPGIEEPIKKLTGRYTVKSMLPMV